ncbi:DUF4189 domain-containing protein [Stenotrophomonas sp. NPDC078853]|uniref:DUF4189 domain-containing protein n=1 Tax=Stenotrophomonas sp. NPDC078853 TaxID=3364534 RepID=UPI00384A972F
MRARLQRVQSPPVDAMSSGSASSQSSPARKSAHAGWHLLSAPPPMVNRMHNASCAFLLLSAVIVCSWLPAVPAFAEGRCPPGQYPVGGQGVGGCAPIPGSAASLQRAAPQPAAPTSRWGTRWGAVAASDSTSDAGAAAGRRAKAAAISDAMADCRRNGAPDCKIMAEYSNQCFAWVSPDGGDGKGLGGLGEGMTPELALKKAMSYCDNPKGNGCKVAYSACSLPELEAL